MGRRGPSAAPYIERLEVTVTPATAETLRSLARSADVPVAALLRDLIEHALTDLEAHTPARRMTS